MIEVQRTIEPLRQARAVGLVEHDAALLGVDAPPGERTDEYSNQHTPGH